MTKELREVKRGKKSKRMPLNTSNVADVIKERQSEEFSQKIKKTGVK